MIKEDLMTYTYKRYAFKDGKLIHEEERTIKENAILACTGQLGPLAFHKLLDRWNKSSVHNSKHDTNPYLYVYVAA